MKEMMKEQIQLLNDWNKMMADAPNVEVAEQIRKNIETIYELSLRIDI